MFFSYRLNAKNQNNIITEKEDKKLPLFYLLLVFILFFTERRINHEGWQMHEKVRK